MVRQFYVPDDKRLPAVLKQQARSLSDVQRPTGTEKDRTVRRLGETVAALPIPGLELDSSAGFAVTGDWVTRASATLTVPAGRTLARVMGIANAEALDDLTGGVTNTRLRILIGGVASREFSASKDAGASKVLNVLAGTHQRVWAVTPGSTITVAVQLIAWNPAAYPPSPQNWAQISAQATFTN